MALLKEKPFGKYKVETPFSPKIDELSALGTKAIAYFHHTKEECKIYKGIAKPAKQLYVPREMKIVWTLYLHRGRVKKMLI